MPKRVPELVDKELKARGISLDRDGFIVDKTHREAGLKSAVGTTDSFGDHSAQKTAFSQKNEGTHQKTGFSIIDVEGVRFALLNELGNGGFSRVKYAQNLKTGEWVAAKIGLFDFNELANNPEDENGEKKYPNPAAMKAKAKRSDEAAALMLWRKRSRQEKDITKAHLKAIADAKPDAKHNSEMPSVHGGIRKVERSGKAYYKSYLFTPLGERDLKSTIDSELLDEGKAAKNAKELLQSLLALEENKIMHDDIKPGNIIIFADGTAQLSDFGGAHKKGEGHASIHSTYTQKYAAPERLLKGAKNVSSHASDVYSMGLVLAEMYGIPVAYNPPRKWINTDGKETEYTHLPVKPSHLNPSPEIKALILQMTVSNPDDRLTATQAFSNFKKTPEAAKISEGKLSAVLNRHDKKSSSALLANKTAEKKSVAFEDETSSDTVLDLKEIAEELLLKLKGRIEDSAADGVSHQIKSVKFNLDPGKLEIKKTDDEKESSTEGVIFKIEEMDDQQKQASILGKGFYAAWKQMEYIGFQLDNISTDSKEMESSTLMENLLTEMVKEAIADDGERAIEALKEKLGSMSSSEPTKVVWGKEKVVSEIGKAYQKLQAAPKSTDKKAGANDDSSPSLHGHSPALRAKV